PIHLIVTQKEGARGHFVAAHKNGRAWRPFFARKARSYGGEEEVVVGLAADGLVGGDFLALAGVLDTQRAQGGGADDVAGGRGGAGTTGRAHGTGTHGGRQAADGVDAGGGVVDHGAIGEADGGAAVL